MRRRCSSRLLPLVETDFVDRRHLVADAKSGVSGAGRKAEVDILFSEASDNFKAYAVAGHRHHPEIVQSLRQAGGSDVGLTFVPHLVPMIRGICKACEFDLNPMNILCVFGRHAYGDPSRGEGYEYVNFLRHGGDSGIRSVSSSRSLGIPTLILPH